MRMRVPVIVLGIAVAAWTAACERAPGGVRPQQAAVAGALPPVDIPLGPLPGPAEADPDAINPYAADAVALMEGRRLFTRFNCAGCHGGHGGGGMGPSLRDVSWMYGGTDPRIYDSIAEGRTHGMPAWGRMLPAEQIWKLTAYVQSLGSPREPAPPTGVTPERRDPPSAAIPATTQGPTEGAAP